MKGIRSFGLAAFVMAALWFGTGCDAMVHADQEECTQAFDHIVKVQSGGGLKGWAKRNLVKGVTWATGDREDFVSNCMGRMSRSQVRCILRVHSQAGMKRCK